VSALYKEDSQSIPEVDSRELSDGSRTFRKTREKMPERESVSSPSSKDGNENPRNGLTRVAAIAVMDPSVEDIQNLRSEMKAIRGQDPSHSAVVNVRTALGHSPVSGFVEHLRGVNPRYRPGGHCAVATWTWFVSTAKSYVEAEAQAKPQGSTAIDQCRHGLSVDLCSQCPQRPEFNAAMEAF
jgi:hypothetical protein